MHFKFRNTNDAFRGLVGGIHDGSIPTVEMPSRYGDVLMIPEPVIVTYERPTERVLFNQARDCNPFFHVYEALWMLAGRNDVEPLAYYNNKMREFSDDGNTLNAAYGNRWRNYQRPIELCELQRMNHLWELAYYTPNRTDQLKEIISQLKTDLYSRRCVLQIWNVTNDLLIETRDKACNTHAYFLVETGDCPRCKDHPGTEGTWPGVELCHHCNGTPHDVPRYLNMTVCNRSNDLVWGMLGANVVHFSFLLEYMAAQLGLEVGSYHQITNNLHVYRKNWKPEEWLGKPDNQRTMHDAPKEKDRYESGELRLIPLVGNTITFDVELQEFAKHAWGNVTLESSSIRWTEPFLNGVAWPMYLAFEDHKTRDYERSLDWVERITADDWRIACRNWITKRQRNWQRKQQAGTSTNQT